MITESDVLEEDSHPLQLLLRPKDHRSHCLIPLLLRCPPRDSVLPRGCRPQVGCHLHPVDHHLPPRLQHSKVLEPKPVSPCGTVTVT